MPRIPYARPPTTIPLEAMPLNKNFVSVESRLKSLERYKGDVPPRVLADAGLFYLGTSLLICYNCGFLTPLTEDGKIEVGIVHGRLCNVMPDSPSYLEYHEVKEELKKDSESPLNASEDVKLGTTEQDEKIKDNDLTSAAVKDKFKEKEIKSGNVVKGESEEVKSDDSTSAVNEEDAKEKEVKNKENLENEDEEISNDEEPEGMFWDCAICGEDEDIKAMNISCGHRTYCIVCAKNCEECSFCKKKVIGYFPLNYED